MKILLSFAICAAFLLPGLALAEKTDIIVLKNGDRITGEIKNLEAGLLEYKTDTMGTVNIEWRFISEVISETNHSVEITDGERVLGTLQKPEGDEHILVGTVDGPVEVQADEVVSVWPVEATFVDRMDLDVSFGLDYKKATDISNLNAALDFRARGDERLTEASFRTDITRQSGVNDQTRWELDAFHEYLLPDQRFRNWFGKLESNDATGVDLRTSGGGAFGKYLRKTNKTWFTVSVGLQAIQENPQGADSETNIEAVGSLRYRYFRYADPERSFDTTFNVFPSLTESGRVRAGIRSTFKLELVEDLFWSFELWATHDNEPLSINVENTDYGFITSVGWSY
jgi:hypothetical protein